MKYEPEITGKIIREERKKKGLTQEALGKKVGVRGKQISNYEQGKLFPKDAVLSKMCEIFDCEWGYLLGETDYSDKTKLRTEIFNNTGLGAAAISNILKITNGKKSLGMGYSNEDYRRILNNLLSSKGFVDFVEALYEYDEMYQMSPLDDLKNEIGEDRFLFVHEFETSSVDCYSEENASISDVQAQDIKEYNSAVDQEYTLVKSRKVLRYFVYEAFEAMMKSLYPDD